MKTNWKIGIIGFLFIGVVGCSDEQQEVMENEANDQQYESELVTELDGFEELLDKSFAYMEDPQFDLISPSELYDLVLFGNPNDFLILDVRDTTTFGAGNITGSVNIPQRVTPLENMVEQLPKDKEIIVVCFSGHQAGQTTAMLNALGYNAKALQFGMGGYASGTELGATIPGKAARFEVDKTGYEAEETFDMPEITYLDNMSVNQLMMSQAKEYLDKEMPAVMGALDVKEIVENDDMENYQIIDIRLAEHYENGHVPQAVNIPYDELFASNQIKTVNPEKTTVVIGYNGYDASQAARLLNQLEYPAVPMAYGMSFWSGDEDIIGQPPIDFKSTESLPTKELKFDLDGGDVSTSCS